MKTERTEAGDQGLLPGTSGRMVPPTRIQRPELMPPGTLFAAPEPTETQPELTPEQNLELARPEPRRCPDCNRLAKADAECTYCRRRKRRILDTAHTEASRWDREQEQVRLSLARQRNRSRSLAASWFKRTYGDAWRECMAEAEKNQATTLRSAHRRVFR